MKIVSGTYGGRPLKTLEGKTTRPTSDKVRGAIFNMIGPYFEGGRVLDLYAGSGGLSIEAVSRGMSSAVLVERDRKAQTIVAENIQMTKEVGKFQLLKMDAERALEQVSGEFDLIFLDPPYAKEQIVADIEKMAEKDSYMEEAYEMLKHMSVDEKKRLEYEAREKAIRDYHSQMQGMREEGFAEGKEQGKKARKMRKVTSIITNMLRKGKSPEEIADLTGEELEEILEIKRQEPT